MKELTPAQRVFGVPAEGGPFELLGLASEPTSAENVRAAAARRYQRLAAGGFDPLDVVAAQEAVAAAEAQLADPDVQREWLRLHHARAAAPSQARRPAPPPAAEPWVPAVRAALARAGGWNRKSITHVGAISNASGIDPVSLVRAAATAARPRPVPRPAHRTGPTHSAPPVHHIEIDAPSVVIPLAAAAAAVALSAATLLSTLIVRAVDAPAGSTPPAAAAPLATLDPPTAESLDPLVPSDATTTESLLDAMVAAVALLETTPAEAAWRMEEAVVAFASRWTEADVSERQRARALAREFLAVAAPGGAASERVVGAVAAPLGESPPAPPTPSSARALVWSAALRAQLAADSSLSPTVTDALNASTPASESERTFAGGGRSALGVLAIEASRTPDVEPAFWDAWVEMLDTLSEGRALARERQAIALGTLETLLLSPAPPSRSRASLHAVEVLLPRAGLAGTRAATARTRLLAWIDDPRVASIDLAVLMRAASLPELASRELSPSASADARGQLRDSLMREWGMSVPASPAQRLEEAWTRAQRSLARSSDDTPTEMLTRAVGNARLVGAASLAWEGQTIAADDRIEMATDVDLRRLEDNRGVTPSSDGRWTVEYHSVRRNAESALEAVERVGRLSTLGPIDARTLARLAYLGSPPPVRVRAQGFTTDRADEINVVEALLEQLPRAPRTPRVGEMLSTVTGVSLGSPRDEAWMLRARRALVDRLLGLLDPEDAPARAGQLAMHLRDALSGAASAGIAPPDTPAAALADVADALLRETVGMGVATSLDAEEIRRRREGRRRVAEGPLQRSVAEALALAETLGVLAQGERPQRAGETRAILDDLSLRQRRATNVFEQLDAALGAAARLWGVRLGYASDATAWAPATFLTPRAVVVAGAIAAPSVPDDERLAALDPSDPASYLRLAEEIAYEARSGTDNALARRLALLSAHLAAGDPESSRVASSACVLLADLSTDAQRRNWLRALADSFGARDGLLLWRVERSRDFSARLAAAETLGLARAEENRRAAERYERSEVRAVLREYAHAIPGGLDTLEHRITHAPSCPECKNERVVRSPSDPSAWVLCHTCRGAPSPPVDRDLLIRALRVERAMLGEGDDWGIDYVARAGAPLRDLTLEEAAQHYGVDLTRSVYRAGSWERPASP